MNIEQSKSFTGINQFRKDKPVIGFIFSDDTCPICDGKLNLLVKDLFGTPIAIRYECKSCGYRCPIKYNIDGHICTKTECKEPIPSPVYDKSIFEFRQSFG